MLESVLRRDPNHLGANHYYIHATEASPHPESRVLIPADQLSSRMCDHEQLGRQPTNPLEIGPGPEHRSHSFASLGHSMHHFGQT